MTHFTHAEFVDLIEDRLEPRRAAHVDACASCREQAGTLRALLHEAAAVNEDVPEPSPLFWPHMAARLREEIAAHPTPAGRGGIWTGWRVLVPVAAAAALVVAVFSGALLMRAGPDGRAPSAGAVERLEPVEQADRTGALAVDGSSEVVPDAANAEVWAVLTAAASDVKFEDAHAAGMHAHTAAIDLAVRDLTAAERTELGRLLQTELKRSSN